MKVSSGRFAITGRLDGVRRAGNSLVLIKEAPMRKLRIATAGLMAAGLMAVGATAAGCAVGGSQPRFRRVGPLITLRVGIYGNPGYQQSGLYAEYERLHPDVKIIQVRVAGQDAYWRGLQARLTPGRGNAKSGGASAATGSDDVQAIPVADIGAVTGPLSGDFVPLNTLGGGAGGGSALADGWLPWVAQQATSRAGTTYALGAEIGPLATCYRTSLLAEAGLPTSPKVLARDWSTWRGYLQMGKLFKARITRGPAFTDSAASLYDAMAAQAREQYYSPAGHLVVATNPAIKAAWQAGVQASRDGLTAKLAPQSGAWERGLSRAAFATVLCPAWMLPEISTFAGALSSRGWNVTAAPGGTGSAGGFYLALPRAGRHQEAAFQLAEFLTGEQAGIDLFRTQGDFPANLAAVTAVESVTSPYFSGAPIGKIFGTAADRTPTATAGPATGAIGAEVTGKLDQVEAGQLGSAAAWRAALRDATTAAAKAPPAARQG
jgi:cellobiose transport system substrate-binding protein